MDLLLTAFKFTACKTGIYEMVSKKSAFKEKKAELISLQIKNKWMKSIAWMNVYKTAGNKKGPINPGLLIYHF